MAERWTESRVFNLLDKPFPKPAHVHLSGVRNGTGYARKQTRTADGLILSVYPSRGLWMAGVEIKVSKGDWRKELADVDKSCEIQRFCHYWYVAAPKGIIPLGKVPDTWGLIECTDKTAAITKPAPKLSPLPPDMLFVCSLLRRFSESNIPSVQVEETITAHLNDAKAGWEKLHRYELESLREMVRNFEEASGISLSNTWSAGRIGEIVKFITESGLHSPDKIVDYYRRQAEQAKQQIEKFIQSLEIET